MLLALTGLRVNALALPSGVRPIPAVAPHEFVFGPFRLLPSQQLLLEGDVPVPVGARALQLLTLLLERAGEVVGKEELVARTWPETFVEDSNLRVHIAGLRRALQDGDANRRFIVNVPGRGYSFVGPVQRTAPGTRPPPIPDRGARLPPPPPRLIGRDDAVSAVRRTLRDHRFVTLVGPGGIGKTTVALAVARELATAFRDGVVFADLGSVSSAPSVPTALSAMLGLAVVGDDPLPALITFLRDREMLLVLDNCEHVIEIATDVAERIFADARGVSLIATSREPLRTVGERVHRLPPLDNPPRSAGITAADALTFPGVQLLVERAAASLGSFELTDADAPFAAEICRRLDGIALAIEFAAGRLAAFGMRDLAARLDDRFDLLTSGRRTALPRHQTLAATLEWSYGLLLPPGRALLRRLSIFVGDFTAEAAAAVSDMPDAAIAAELAELVAKSLLVVDTAVTPPRYRQLDTTRLYGLEKLRQTQELAQTRRLHAQYFLDRFASAEADGEVLSSRAWLAVYGRDLDNLRRALDWASSREGDPGILIALTARTVPLWVQLSLTGECRRRMRLALEKLSEMDDHGDVMKRHQMHLSAALGWALIYGAGRSDDIETIWAETLRLAEELGDWNYRVRALWGRWLGCVNKGDWPTALDLAQRLQQVVRQAGDAPDRMTADRLFATTMHYIGDQQAAQEAIERMLAEADAVPGEPKVVRFHVEQKVTARYFHARILLLLGYVDRARRAVERNLEEGQALGHALSFASVLGQGACPIALLTGELEAARRYGVMLLEHAGRHQLGLWHAWARCFEGAVAAREGRLQDGLAVMRATFDGLGESRLLPRFMVLLGEMAGHLGMAGDVPGGLSIIDGLILRCESSGEKWFLPEAMRIKSGLVRETGGRVGRETAEQILHDADQLAQRQHAHVWRLRIAIDRATFRRGAKQGSTLAPLRQIVDMFRDAGDSADLRAARKILAQ